MTNELVVEIVIIVTTRAVVVALVVIRGTIIHIHEVPENRNTILVLKLVHINTNIIKEVAVQAAVEVVALEVIPLVIHVVHLVSLLEKIKVLTKKRVLQRILVLGAYLLEVLLGVIVQDLYLEIEVYLLRSHLFNWFIFVCFILFSLIFIV